MTTYSIFLRGVRLLQQNQRQYHHHHQQQRLISATTALSSSTSRIIRRCSGTIISSVVDHDSQEQDHHFHHQHHHHHQQQQQQLQRRHYNSLVSSYNNNNNSIFRRNTISINKGMMFHGSSVVFKSDNTDQKAAAAAAKKKEEDDADIDPDEGEEPPEWQNPLHHNNPDMQKVFPEDLSPGEELEVQPSPPLVDSNDPDKILAPDNVKELADEIVHLSMLEMNELVNKIADHFGFEKPPFAVAGVGGGAADGGGDDEDDEDAEAAAPVEEKTIFDVKLLSFDASSKIKVIKEVRALAGLGLKEAKEIVESAPKVIQKDVKKENAEEIKAKLEAVGAVVEIV